MSINSYPQQVKLVEVGPRDGLQNESTRLSVDVRIEFINKLVTAGLTVVEAGSFVSAKKIPQMQQSDLVLKGLQRQSGLHYPVLVPNLQGLEKAMESGAREIAIFAAASESFSQSNINCSIAESIQRFSDVTQQALASGIKVRGYLSCVLGCPYEGAVAVERVVEVATHLHALGCYEISLGDTLGVGTPLKVKQMIEQVAKAVPLQQLAVHFHDSYGQALANILAALQTGVTTIDSSVSGLGGCPYAKGASGNVATEDVLYMLNGMGIQTGVDMDKLLLAGAFICRELGGRKTSSRAAQAILKNGLSD